MSKPCGVIDLKQKCGSCRHYEPRTDTQGYCLAKPFPADVIISPGCKRFRNADRSKKKCKLYAEACGHAPENEEE